MENKRGLIALFLLVQLGVLGPTCWIVRAQTTITGPIKTIVVLVMENRSFDHFVGLMKKLNPQIDGLNGNEYNLVNPGDPSSPRVQISDTAEFVDPDPGHEYEQVAEQIYGSSKTLTQPRMDGFVAQAESMMPGLAQRVMSAFRPEVVPVTTALAMNFALFDRYFSSVPSSTQPNRFFVHSATSHGLLGNDQTTLAQGLSQRTIFEDVDDAGLSFGVYYQQIPAMLFFNNLRKLKYVNKFKNYGPTFAIDAKLGILPNYVVIEQRYFDVLNSPANDDHPTHDVSQGQKLIKEVYETLRGSPQWNQMLFLITYDEHGGFYDHVPPPNSGVPNPDGVTGPPPNNFNFDRLGVRVPTIAISPWIEKGTVVHRAAGPTATSEYEHSSIPATVRKLFNLPQPPLTAREAWAGNFGSLITRQTPRTDTPVTLPTPPWSLRHSATNESAPLSEFQHELVTLASSLKNRFNMPPIPNRATAQQHHFTIGEANFFIRDAVSSFMQKGMQQVQAGMDPDTEVHV